MRSETLVREMSSAPHLASGAVGEGAPAMNRTPGCGPAAPSALFATPAAFRGRQQLQFDEGAKGASGAGSGKPQKRRGKGRPRTNARTVAEATANLRRNIVSVNDTARTFAVESTVRNDQREGQRHWAACCTVFLANGRLRDRNGNRGGPVSKKAKESAMEGGVELYVVNNDGGLADAMISQRYFGRVLQSAAAELQRTSPAANELTTPEAIKSVWVAPRKDGHADITSLPFVPTKVDTDVSGTSSRPVPTAASALAAFDHSMARK